ncbi:hypothetical protein COEREDRAFT_81914 [Coemansia reversa NRRL 1564]|uniref:VPS9 domain-containing protein n=1 Tax=Coemansia reversa (strain ATCC 12441 / NRRL 1564) TaxID=763665 RepID=A0A2G5B989_COERN|nr:hypothetical protein COEREDRAFT_81914 [Coemansia reversa NRRL 1564]|eukprot:PIA15585.1 hypothetical protein COEREDRAFT_81914 [Coemansia reversa NRRL 1564]
MTNPTASAGNIPDAPVITTVNHTSGMAKPQHEQNDTSTIEESEQRQLPQLNQDIESSKAKVGGFIQDGSTTLSKSSPDMGELSSEPKKELPDSELQGKTSQSPEPASGSRGRTSPVSEPNLEVNPDPSPQPAPSIQPEPIPQVRAESPSKVEDLENVAADVIPQGAGMRRVSTSSSSRVHDAIQDIISQFDPLKVSASTSQLADDGAARAAAVEEERRQAELQARFEPETDGFSYNDFLQQLRAPAAKPVARTVKSFLTEFSRRPMTLSEQVRFVHEFLDFITVKMRESEMWQHLSDRDFDNAREGMEKLVMNRLYPLCFSPSTSDDADKDHVLREKMSLFRWIREDHLDIPTNPQNAAFLQFAKSELLKMNNFKSPRDKVICILNCCTVVYALLRNSGSTDAVGADRFLPLLIYVVITANPPRLVSNIQYITRFRSLERMQSEAGYYVTNLQGAVTFIESMDASCLSISQEEFDKNIEMTIWEIDIEKRSKEKQSLPIVQQPRIPVDVGAERAQWLLDRSSDLAKSTLEKTNTFVGRLISELSTPGSDITQGSPRQSATPQGPASTSNADADVDADAEVNGAEAVDRANWNSALALVHDMFPNIDGDVVELVFESNRGVVSRTIEQLLEMSMGNEALQVAIEHESDEVLLGDDSVPQVALNSVQGRSQLAVTAAPTSSSTANVGGQNEVDEMEKWKGHWADEDDDSDSDEHAAAIDKSQNSHPIPANDTIPVKVSDPAHDKVGDGQPAPESERPPTPPSKDSVQENAKPGTVADGVISHSSTTPDTSGDEELARRLQEEFEKQAQAEQQQQQQQQRLD